MVVFSKQHLDMATSSLQSSKSSIYGSLRSSKSSKPSIYGSLRSSKSSNTVFGSCLSTTDTIGSFRTAFTGSLSTIYFSTKGEEDSNTLNWTMNYHSFDELSDTSTLVGEDVGNINTVNSER